MDDLDIVAQVLEIADLIADKPEAGKDRQYICEDALWRLDRLAGTGWQRGARVWDEKP